MSTEPDRLREALARRSIALERELGRGGMSTVYLARDLRHDRLLAVKVLRPDVAGGAERFVREIELVASLVHPHIVPVYDSGAVDGVPYFVMPFIEGESLRRRLEREGQLPVAEAVQVAGEVGEALEFAHRRGILHRDIKPENVLLQEGHALVADFGVARALSQAAVGAREGGTVTEAGLILGTAEYMSPEQASGDRALDGRTDLYSLGCVLFEMLTGRPPFTGESPRAVLATRFREPAPSVRQLRPEAPPTLAAVVEKALAADPAERFTDATTFLGALRSPGGARPLRSRVAWPRSRWWLLAVLGAGVLTWLGLYLTGDRARDPRRIVVASLSNETGDTALGYLGRLAADRLTASLAGVPGVQVVTSATIIPSRLTTGLRKDSLDDPERLHVLSEETGAGTLVSGSYFRTGRVLSFQAEITDANLGVLLAAVGPVSAPEARPEGAIDALGRGVAGAVGNAMARATAQQQRVGPSP